MFDDNKPDTLQTASSWRGNWPWQNLDALVISPGIPHLHPTPHPAAAHAAVKNIEIISEVEIALRAEPQARIVVITGTNGKSTTTALVGHCLQQAGEAVAVGGNIGRAACSLDDPGPDGVIVLELSSYQLETTPALSPTIAVVLNITPDHLDRHAGMAGYVAAKTRALIHCASMARLFLGSQMTCKTACQCVQRSGDQNIAGNAGQGPAGSKIVWHCAVTIMPKMRQRPGWCCIVLGCNRSD